MLFPLSLALHAKGPGHSPLWRPKSSKWIYALGYSSRADVTKVLTSFSYSSPLTRLSLRPKYRGSFKSVSLSVPQSRTTGNTRPGCIPPQMVVRTSLAMEIKMPPHPWSPIPRISSPSASHQLQVWNVEVGTFYQ